MSGTTTTNSSDVFGWPYFWPEPLAQVIEPTIVDYLNGALPILLPPYIDPAALTAVQQYAVQLSGSTMSGPLYLSPILPTAPSEAASKQYVDTMIAAFVPLNITPEGIEYAQGGGHFIAFGWDNTNVTMFVDNLYIGAIPTTAWVIANYVPIAGGTMTGRLNATAGCAFDVGGDFVCFTDGLGNRITQYQAGWYDAWLISDGTREWSSSGLALMTLDGDGNLSTNGTVNGVPLAALAERVAELETQVAALEAARR